MPSKSTPSLPNQHADIIRAMQAESRTEHRRAKRTAQRTRTQIFPCSEGRIGHPVAVQLQDFSDRGLSFHAKWKMSVGDQFVFRLPRADGGAATPVLCTVAYCRRSSDTEFRVGAEFTCVIRPGNDRIEPATDAEVRRIGQSVLS